MKIVGCDLHTRYQQIAMLDAETGELVERRLEHESGEARAFYAALSAPVRVGSRPPGTRAGSSACWPSWGTRCGSGMRRRSGRRRVARPIAKRRAGLLTSFIINGRVAAQGCRRGDSAHYPMVMKKCRANRLRERGPEAHFSKSARSGAPPSSSLPTSSTRVILRCRWWPPAKVRDVWDPPERSCYLSGGNGGW
jgi:hypothetical protein